MKTAVSIPDSLFEAADRLARRRRVSRSALYAEALRLLLAGEDDADAAITAQLDAIHGDPGGDGEGTPGHRPRPGARHGERRAVERGVVIGRGDVWWAELGEPVGS